MMPLMEYRLNTMHTVIIYRFHLNMQQNSLAKGWQGTTEKCAQCIRLKIGLVRMIFAPSRVFEHAFMQGAQGARRPLEARRRERLVRGLAPRPWSAGALEGGGGIVGIL